MARRTPTDLVSDSERPMSTRDMDNRVIYPGVAGFDPLGHGGKKRTLLFDAIRPRGTHDYIKGRIRLRGK